MLEFELEHDIHEDALVPTVATLNAYADGEVVHLSISEGGNECCGMKLSAKEAVALAEWLLVAAKDLS